MKKSRLILSLVASFAGAISLLAQMPPAPMAAAVTAPAAPKPRTSPHEVISANVDHNRVTIIYGRPYSKDPKTGEIRKIWGTLVPYDKIWRTGADEATTLIAQQPINLGGTVVPAGTYTLFTFPSADGSAKLVVNKEIGQWGVDPYNETHEFARIDLKKDMLDAPVDQFTMSIGKNAGGGGIIKMFWETTQYSVTYKNIPAPAVTFPAASPTTTLKQRVGLTDIDIVYSRPGAKGRTIFGGLQPYGEIWRAGANTATKVVFSAPVKIEGHELAAGTYGLFAIPGATEWTVIFNKIANQWGAYLYDSKDDVLRVKVAPVMLADFVETFTIDFNDLRDESATLNLIWEKTRVPVKVQVEVVSKVVAQIEAAMAGTGKKPYASAAMFYEDHGLDLKQAIAWMDAAIAEQPDAFYLYYHKAKIQAKAGDKAGALASAQKSMEMAAQDKTVAKAEYTRLNQAVIDGLK
jgi:hypothetical protein